MGIRSCQLNRSWKLRRQPSLPQYVSSILVGDSHENGFYSSEICFQYVFGAGNFKWLVLSSAVLRIVFRVQVEIEVAKLNEHLNLLIVLHKIVLAKYQTYLVDVVVAVKLLDVDRECMEEDFKLNSYSSDNEIQPGMLIDSFSFMENGLQCKEKSKQGPSATCTTSYYQQVQVSVDFKASKVEDQSAVNMRNVGMESTAELLEKQLSAEISKMTFDEAVALTLAFCHYLNLLISLASMYSAMLLTGWRRQWETWVVFDEMPIRDLGLWNWLVLDVLSDSYDLVTNV